VFIVQISRNRPDVLDIKFNPSSLVMGLGSTQTEMSTTNLHGGLRAA
jgi:hypothetical protein